MKDNLVIFGNGKIAEAITYLGKPLVGLSKFDEKFSPDSCHVFVAVGYQGMNMLRTQKVAHFKNLGFQLAKYTSPYVLGNYTIGDNSIVMDGAIIQPCAKFGNNVFVWGGAMIGHHANIEDNCWLTGGCQIGGITKMGQSTFVGLGAIVGNEIVIGEKCMLGAGTLSCKSIKEGTVLVAPNTEPHRLNSDQFTRMSTCFRV